MKFYDITYMVADEVNEKLSSLAKRYKKVNGWGGEGDFAICIKF